MLDPNIAVHDGGGGHHEGCGGGISWNGGLETGVFERTMKLDRVVLDEDPGAERPERAFRVIAQAGGFAHRRNARGGTPSQQDRALHLSAWDRHPIVDPRERSAPDRERCVA